MPSGPLARAHRRYSGPVLGAVVLAADKGALCLTLSAFDTLAENEFAALLPGIGAMMAQKGRLFVMWGILLLPLGFTIQAIGLIKTRVFSLWQTVPLLIGAPLTAMPDGFEIIGVAASMLLAAGLIPIGLRYLGGRYFPNSRSRTPQDFNASLSHFGTPAGLSASRRAEAMSCSKDATPLITQGPPFCQ